MTAAIFRPMYWYKNDEKWQISMIYAIHLRWLYGVTAHFWGITLKKKNLFCHWKLFDIYYIVYCKYLFNKGLKNCIHILWQILNTGIPLACTTSQSTKLYHRIDEAEKQKNFIFVSWIMNKSDKPNIFSC